MPSEIKIRERKKSLNWSNLNVYFQKWNRFENFIYLLEKFGVNPLGPGSIEKNKINIIPNTLNDINFKLQKIENGFQFWTVNFTNKPNKDGAPNVKIWNSWTYLYWNSVQKKCCPISAVSVEF